MPNESPAAAWLEVARSARDALDALGHHTPRCLPGEPEACGGNAAAHAAALLGAVKAVAEARITHLHEPAGIAIADQAYDETAARLAAEPPCSHASHRDGGDR